MGEELLGEALQGSATVHAQGATLRASGALLPHCFPGLAARNVLSSPDPQRFHGEVLR